MSRFLCERYTELVPYTPGEQPRDRKYIKLNTNESPYPPSPKAQLAAAQAAAELQLYPDPTCDALTREIAALCGVTPDQVLVTNGSDEILNFAFMAFCDTNHPAAFPNITYGFYSVFAALNGVEYREIPLDTEFKVRPADYAGLSHTIFIANPNAPTGLALTPAQVEEILQQNPDRVVVIDEAYVDFGAESCVPLIQRYDNLLVTQTFSKSRSMAGARLGFGVGNRELIADLNRIKYATNPYNINRMTMAAGLGVLADEAYTRCHCLEVAQTRQQTAAALQAMGFTLTDSVTNFLFARHPDYDGESLYRHLKSDGILVRHFNKPGIDEYVRITIGTPEEMQALLQSLRRLLEG